MFKISCRFKKFLELLPIPVFTRCSHGVCTVFARCWHTFNLFPIIPHSKIRSLYGIFDVNTQSAYLACNSRHSHKTLTRSACVYAWGGGTVDFKRPFLMGNMQILQTNLPTGKSFSFKDLSKKRRFK